MFSRKSSKSDKRGVIPRFLAYSLSDAKYWNLTQNHYNITTLTYLNLASVHWTMFSGQMTPLFLFCLCAVFSHFFRLHTMDWGVLVVRYPIYQNTIRLFRFFSFSLPIFIFSANSFISPNQLRYTFCQKCFNEIPGDTVTLGDDPMQSQT